MDLKRSTVPFASPARTLRKSQPKSPEQEVKATPPSAAATEGSVSSSIGVENGNNEEGEGMPYATNFNFNDTLMFLVKLFFSKFEDVNIIYASLSLFGYIYVDAIY